MTKSRGIGKGLGPISPNSIAALAKSRALGLRKCLICAGNAVRGSAYCRWHGPTKAAEPVPGKGQNLVEHRTNAGYDVRVTLKAIASDRKANATARTSAARTLAELDGLLGKHQQAPERTAEGLLSDLSRVDLARELARLRRVCAADQAQD